MEYFNDTLNRFQDLIVKGIATNISVSFPAKMEWVGEDTADQNPRTKDDIITVFMFTTALLVGHSESHSSQLLPALGTPEVLLYNIETSVPEWRVVLPAIDDAFLQRLVTLHIEARDGASVAVLEEFYASRFHRVVISLTEM